MERTVFFKSCLGVFQGGGCRGAAFVGAYEEAVARGVSFAEVAGTSAGSIVAAFIGAGASPAQLNKFIADLDFKRFLKRSQAPAGKRSILRFLTSFLWPKFKDAWFDRGLHSSKEIEIWVEDCLRKLLPGHDTPIKFKDLLLPTYIVSTDLVTADVRVWSQFDTPEESVAKAVRSSASIPLFFQPVENRFVDGGILSNLPSFVFSRRNSSRALASKVLAFSLFAEDSKTDIEAATGWSYYQTIANAVVDGGKKLQLGLQPDVHLIQIPTGIVKATDFQKITPELTKTLVESGRDQTRKFINEELMNVKSRRSNENLVYGIDEFYTILTTKITDPIKEVIISEDNTDWVYKIFPAIISLRLRQVPIRVVLPKHIANTTHGVYQRKLLLKLGVKVVEIDGQVPLRAWIFDAEDTSVRLACVGLPHHSQYQKIQAVVYSGDIDSVTIELLKDRLRSLFTGADDGYTYTPRVVAGGVDPLIEKLRTVAQYSHSAVTLEVVDVDLDRIFSLASFIREFKYNQVEHMVRIFNSISSAPFSPAVLELDGGYSSIITPPVVEKSGDNYILFEGTARAVYARDTGAKKLKCVVASGVSAALPSGWIKLDRVRIAGRSVGPETRYEGFSYGDFRHIERQVHRTDSLD